MALEDMGCAFKQVRDALGFEELGAKARTQLQNSEARSLCENKGWTLNPETLKPKP